MIVMHVSNVASREDAEPFIRAIDGKTYMNFKVRVCPAYGMFAVNVETDYDTDESDARGMLMDLMFSTIRKSA